MLAYSLYKQGTPTQAVGVVFLSPVLQQLPEMSIHQGLACGICWDVQNGDADATSLFRKIADAVLGMHGLSTRIWTPIKQNGCMSKHS
jgi:hypothetical protein